MDIRFTSSRHFSRLVVWMLIAGATVIIVIALLARAQLNLQAALTDKPDLAVMILLPEEGIKEVSLLRDLGLERDYLVETNSGLKFVKLRKTGGKWHVAEVNRLRED